MLQAISTRITKELYPGSNDELSALAKVLRETEPSSQRDNSGIRPRPFDFEAAINLRAHHPQHSTCIDAKATATVGLGLVNDTTEAQLDELCEVNWQFLIDQVSEDLEQVGNGYMEVVRRENGQIGGLFWVPATDTWVVVERDNEGNTRNKHFEVLDAHSRIGGGTGATQGNKYAMFGDLEGFLERHEDFEVPADLSEIIQFRESSSLNRHYGVPKWLAAIPYIELAQAMVQHQFDFHINRGVPEFMLFIMGTKLRKEDWAKVTASLRAQIGLGNSHKTIALNFGNPDTTVQLEKLAMDGTMDGEFFSMMQESLSTSIVSAHRVPMSIAGIVISGKMGATNETSNALMSFQALVIGRRQKAMESVLGCTLGHGTMGVGGLSRNSFEFVTIIDEMAEMMEKLQPLDTMSRMREELPDAASSGRNLSDGLRKSTASEVASEMIANLLRSGGTGS